MAKTFLTINELTAAERKIVTDTKRKVLGMASDFDGFRKKVSDIAPGVIGLFNSLLGSRPVGTFGLADFARLYDPTVPTHAATNNDGDGYRVHPVYMAIAYMQRAVRPKNTGRQGVFNAAGARFERMIATLLSFAKDPAPLWAAIASEFVINAKSLQTLKNRVADVQPILDLSSIIKPVNFAPAKVLHMEKAAATGTAANAAAANIEKMRTVRDGMNDLSRAGRRVRTA